MIVFELLALFHCTEIRNVWSDVLSIAEEPEPYLIVNILLSTAPASHKSKFP